MALDSSHSGLSSRRYGRDKDELITKTKKGIIFSLYKRKSDFVMRRNGVSISPSAVLFPGVPRIVSIGEISASVSNMIGMDSI